MNKIISLSTLTSEISKCSICKDYLPQKPRPILEVHATSKILIIGQAPSLTVNETGIVWNDASGKRLMEWLQITREIFYDRNKISILPMGFCYPGKAKTGDLPPRKECAPKWHPKLLSFLNPRLILLIGHHAQQYYLKQNQKKNLTETVRAFKDYQPLFIPLPHPSPLNNRWLSKNTWFVKDNLPELQKMIKKILSDKMI